MANKVKELWAAGKVVVNAWLAIPSGFSAEVMAQCGFDSVTVDIQHGVQDYQSMVQCFQAIQAHPVTPMVRVPWNEPGIIGKVLDGGAFGVICPMINTPEEAERFVATYQKTANDETLCIPMIETRSAVENLDAILEVPGIAGVYIGPSDLGFSYGLHPTLDRTEPEIIAIYDRIVKACEKRGIFPGIHCSGSAGATLAIQRGFRLVTLLNDSGMMAMAARSHVAQTREGSGGRA
jgi:4-hydroxy-2-oxoheptanedioate aldolase